MGTVCNFGSKPRQCTKKTHRAFAFEARPRRPVVRPAAASKPMPPIHFARLRNPFHTTVQKPWFLIRFPAANTNKRFGLTHGFKTGAGFCPTTVLPISHSCSWGGKFGGGKFAVCVGSVQSGVPDNDYTLKVSSYFLMLFTAGTVRHSGNGPFKRHMVQTRTDSPNAERFRL